MSDSELDKLIKLKQEEGEKKTKSFLKKFALFFLCGLTLSLLLGLLFQSNFFIYLFLFILCPIIVATIRANIEFMG